MQNIDNSINDLFSQLGLPSDNTAIDTFIRNHGPLGNNTVLHQASFWNTSQQAFLKEALSDDSDWAEAVDQLNVRLRV